MKHILISLALLLGLVPAAAAESPVLVELFASQNCTACPKAHRTLQSVRRDHRDDVLVLTWSVDYWDYLGEPDPMALPDAADRQKAYTERFGIRAPYTPQSVYDGAVQCPATRRKAVEANIEQRSRARSSDRPAVEIEATDSGFTLDGDTTSPAEILLVDFLPSGENPTQMVNPVIRAQRLGRWTGGRVSYGATCTASCAVIVQESGQGEVYAARALSGPGGS